MKQQDASLSERARANQTPERGDDADSQRPRRCGMGGRAGGHRPADGLSVQVGTGAFAEDTEPALPGSPGGAGGLQGRRARSVSAAAVDLGKHVSLL